MQYRKVSESILGRLIKQRNRYKFHCVLRLEDAGLGEPASAAAVPSLQKAVGKLDSLVTLGPSTHTEGGVLLGSEPLLSLHSTVSYNFTVEPNLSPQSGGSWQHPPGQLHKSCQVDSHHPHQELGSRHALLLTL